jgi:hypothetical protein
MAAQFNLVELGFAGVSFEGRTRFEWILTERTGWPEFIGTDGERLLREAIIKLNK